MVFRLQNSPVKDPPGAPRTHAQIQREVAAKARSRDVAVALIQEFSPAALVIFTDGSATTNPGPCGAGAYARAPAWFRPHFPAATNWPLGHGSSILAEIWALGMVLERLHSTLQDRLILPPKTIHICSDCRPALGIVFDGHRAGRHARIALRARHLLRCLLHLRPLGPGPCWSHW